MNDSLLLDVINNEVFALYHVPLMKHKTPDKWDSFLTPQKSFGVLSACRRAVFVRIFYNILLEINPHVGTLISPQEITYLQVTSLFAHSVWENKLNNENIVSIKTNCAHFLKRIEAPAIVAEEFAQLLAFNHTAEDNSKHYWLSIIIQSADTLNNMRRANSIFYLRDIPLMHALNQTVIESLLEEVAKNALNLMNVQHDIAYNGVSICKDGVFMPIYDLRNPHPKAKVKKNYEFSNHCYELVIKDIQEFPVLSQYYKNDDLPGMRVNLSENKKLDERNTLRKSAPTMHIKNDFLIKSLRGDSANYFLQFVDGVIPPFTHHPLRFDNKKKYTVNGVGVHERENKVPTYAKEEKKSYSKKQSVTYCMPDLQPQPFNFSEEQVKTVGVLFLNKKNSLLSNHLLTRDAGSCVRPNDFDFAASAELYYKQVANKYLFAKDNLQAFKTALRHDKEFKYHNEVLAHLSFTADNDCQIFINVDTLAARLLAQIYAKILSVRLFNANQCSSDYEVPICYYRPESALHFKHYTKEEQVLDQQEVNELLFNNELLNNNFEFLLFLAPNLFLAYLCAPINNHNVLIELLTQGYFHILDFAVALGMCDIAVLEQLIEEHIATLLDAQTLSQIVFHALNKDKCTLFKYALSALCAHVDAAKYLNQVSPIYKCTLLQLAFQLQKMEYIEILSELNQLAIRQTDNAGNTILHYAVSTDKEHYVQRALDLGADINAINSRGETALYCAIVNSYYNLVRLLLSKKEFTQLDAKVNSVNKPSSLLEVAALQAEPEVLKILYEDGRFDFSQEFGRRTLLSIAEDNSLNLLYLLTLPDIDFRKHDPVDYYEGGNALHKAVERGQVEVVKALLDKGIAVNDTDQSDFRRIVLHFAIYPLHKNYEAQRTIIKLLLDAGSDKNMLYCGKTPLAHAIESDNAAVVKLLMKNGCRINSVMPVIGAALFSKEHLFFKCIKYNVQNNTDNMVHFFRSNKVANHNDAIPSTIPPRLNSRKK